MGESMNAARIIEWNADNRTAFWVREQLGISADALTRISKLHGLKWPAGSALTCSCPNGHDTAHVGYVDGACGHCKRRFPLPDHLAVFEGGKLAKRYCRNGHDTREAGRFFAYRKSWCLLCKEGRETVGVAGRTGAAREAAEQQLERTADEYLRLRDMRFLTPQSWLRDEIDEQIRRLRA